MQSTHMATQINPQIIAGRDRLSTEQALSERLTGTVSASQALTRHQEAARQPAAQAAFVRHFEASAQAQAQYLDDCLRLQPTLACSLPLAGLAVSVKDLFDVAGHPATGGSLALDGRHSALTGQPAAETGDSLAVARLRQAGAILTAHTNLSEFAFSGVGINPHHGTPPNPVTQVLDGLSRIPGGSTSGGAVSVACGAAWAALGSDTGGSIRIPAALQGLVAFKNTQALTPLEGAIPLSTTLDTSCAITTDVAGAVRLHGVLSARTPRLSGRPLDAMRFLLPSTLMVEQLEPAVATAFEQAVRRLSQAGARIVEQPLPALSELAALQSLGSFAAAESWFWHRQRLSMSEHAYDPRVVQRIRRGASMSAADYLQLQFVRRDWQLRLRAALDGFDAALSPTVPCVAPLLAPLQADDDLFFAMNATLLRNPSVVNFLDGCALTLPCQAPNTLPVGLMIWACAHADDAVLNAGLAAEAALRPTHWGR
jgi:aspartyl-tRNA(Asn)/glutamyl-tRNA(Gln) amidotransferase subunit A